MQQGRPLSKAVLYQFWKRYQEPVGITVLLHSSSSRRHHLLSHRFSGFMSMQFPNKMPRLLRNISRAVDYIFQPACRKLSPSSHWSVFAIQHRSNYWWTAFFSHSLRSINLFSLFLIAAFVQYTLVATNLLHVSTKLVCVKGGPGSYSNDDLDFRLLYCSHQMQCRLYKDQIELRQRLPGGENSLQVFSSLCLRYLFRLCTEVSTVRSVFSWRGLSALSFRRP